jgi:peptide/nickel transport system substrate-binding protein
MDPATGFFSGEAEVETNVYQGLLMFNYESSTSFAPILGQSWSASTNASTYTFTLRNDVYFPNGHPFNSSVVWFSIYRAMIMNQVGASFFSNILFNGTTAFAAGGYNVPDGAIQALESAGYTFSATNATLAQQQAGRALASILSNFNPSNSTIQTIMAYSPQAVTVNGTYGVVFNLVNPYVDFLQVLASLPATMIDPAFVDANGGVAVGQPNTYVNIHSMGTGPYEIASYVSGNVLTMDANPNYWAAKLSSSQTNVMLTPPHISVVIIEYTSSVSTEISDLESNNAQLIVGPPIPGIFPQQLSGLAATPGVVVVNNATAPKFNFLMAALDTQQYPYNITLFRQALAHAVNISQILQTVAMGYASSFVGPISPGLAYYNPANLPVYSYDPNLAISLLSQAGFKVSLPNGTTVNPSGTTIPSLTLYYVNVDDAQTKIAEELQIMYANVGITFTLNGFSIATEEADLVTSPTSSSYPGFLLWYWYPSWLDPVFQDMVTQVNSVCCGGIGGDVSWLSNATINAITAALPFETNSTEYLNQVTQVYAMVYQLVPDIWIYALNPYWAQRNYVQGVIYNPGILGNYYPLISYS